MSRYEQMPVSLDYLIIKDRFQLFFPLAGIVFVSKVTPI